MCTSKYLKYLIHFKFIFKGAPGGAPLARLSLWRNAMYSSFYAALKTDAHFISFLSLYLYYSGISPYLRCNLRNPATIFKRDGKCEIR